MSTATPLHLPDYDTFTQSIGVLSLPISSSELHGTLCGYLCAGATKEGEMYLRALMENKRNKDLREATLALFEVFTVSQQQLTNFDFEFQLLLPSDDEGLSERAQAFSEWCEGFTQGLIIAGVDSEQLQEEDSREALQHLVEFAQLDCEGLNIDEEDEQALVEVSEYARMAVLHIYNDLHSNASSSPTSTH